MVCVCERFGETVAVCVCTDNGVADWPSGLHCADHQCRVASVILGAYWINQKVRLEKNENKQKGVK